ncbi:MAG: polyprenol monophosphomannose synthase [Propionibacteriaceae bacterium]|nr:polyprenol monophosphomannose synthase [Propionibacteriaceae bacterium]
MSAQYGDLGRILVIIPTYNEIDNIDMITGRLRAAVPEVDVLIVDDNSPDGTGARADELAAADDHIHVLHRQGKEGLGAAYKAGFAWGLERDYGVLVEFDADGSHQPEQLPAVLEALRDADMVKGSRWVPGGSVVNWPLHRELLSRGGSIYTRIMLGLPYRDITGGLNAFRADTLRAILDDPIDQQGYGIQRDLTWNAHKRGFRILEVPIEFVERSHGESKMSGTVVKEAMVRTTQLGLRHRAAQLRDALTRGRDGLGGAGEKAGRFVGAVSRSASDAVRAAKRGREDR